MSSSRRFLTEGVCESFSRGRENGTSTSSPVLHPPRIRSHPGKEVLATKQEKEAALALIAEAAKDTVNPSETSAGPVAIRMTTAYWPVPWKRKWSIWSLATRISWI